MITKQTVADKIASYLHHGITAEQLADWAEGALMDAEFSEQDAATLAAVVGRLAVADVRAFGLTWMDCEQLLRQLGFPAHSEVFGQIVSGVQARNEGIPDAEVQQAIDEALRRVRAEMSGKPKARKSAARKER